GRPGRAGLGVRDAQPPGEGRVPVPRPEHAAAGGISGPGGANAGARAEGDLQLPAARGVPGRAGPAAQLLPLPVADGDTGKGHPRLAALWFHNLTSLSCKAMGTTFVTLSHESSGKERGFWMRDEMLEVWLRLLALHLPEPTDSGEY